MVSLLPIIYLHHTTSNSNCHSILDNKSKTKIDEELRRGCCSVFGLDGLSLLLTDSTTALQESGSSSSSSFVVSIIQSGPAPAVFQIVSSSGTKWVLLLHNHQPESRIKPLPWSWWSALPKVYLRSHHRS